MGLSETPFVPELLHHWFAFLLLLSLQHFSFWKPIQRKSQNPLLGTHLTDIDQGLHHVKFCSSLCFCGLPVVNWRKSWLHKPSFYCWTVVCIWSKGLNLDRIDATEGPAFASRIAVIFTNTDLKSLLLKLEDTTACFSGSVYRSCLQRAEFSKMQWAIVLWRRPVHSHD